MTALSSLPLVTRCRPRTPGTLHHVLSEERARPSPCGERDLLSKVSTVSYDHWGDRHFRNLGRDSWAGLGHVLLSDLKQVTLSLSLNLVHL